VKVQCTNCQSVFQVPDDKIPSDRPLRATCSKCKQPLAVGPKDRRQSGGSETRAMPMGVDVSLAEVTDAPTAITVELSAEGAYDSPLEVLEEGAMSALVCVDESERLNEVKTALAELNYHSSVASSVKEALSKLRYNYYDLVMLDEEFCGEEGVFS
jgi:predicted Zn finger-like uncharacterized protein